MGREHAGGNRDGSANQEREEGELESGRIAFEYDVANGSLEFERFAKITAKGLAEIAGVLDMKWFIKPKRVPQLCSLDRSGAFAEHLLDRVTWNNMNQEKDQG